MYRLNQKGSLNSLTLPLVIVSLLLIGAVIFAASAYSGKKAATTNLDAQINTAVNAAVAKENTLKNQQFVNQENQTLTSYSGPQADGSFVLYYPKYWSGYVDTSQSQALIGYFNPGVVPSITAQSSIFALSLQVLNQPYSQTVQSFSSQSGVTASAYALPKVPSDPGLLVSGNLNSNNSNVNVTMVVLPLRTQTLELSTEGSQYLSVFNNIILPNFVFSP